MVNYVLVHGSGHGSWCWDRVVPLLRCMGHNVLALDLPGNSPGQTPSTDVTLDTYAEHVAGILESLDGPAVLVGHSLGGITISRAAELQPGKVAVLVYLTAILLADGDSFMSVVSDEPDVQRGLETRASWDLAADRSSVVYKMEQTRHRFYSDCTEEDMEWAQSLLVPQPVGPLVSPMRITDENYGRVPRVYIECTLDNAVSPEFALAMYTAMPCGEVIAMYTGHSPFLSAPGELANHLAGLARYAASSTTA